jgi:uncharacterized protein (TIGR02246 family)
LGRSIFAAVLLATAMALGASAQTPEAPVHAELRALRDDMVSAVNAGDLERLLTHVTDDVVVTWMNGDVSRGKEAIRQYYKRMVSGPGALVQSYSTAVTVDELTTIYAEDAGVAYGSSKDRFVLASGATLDVDGRWTATVVRQDGVWRVASFHASTDMFDNPILDKMKTTAYLLGLFGAVIGLTIGLAVALWVRSRSKRAPASAR